MNRLNILGYLDAGTLASGSLVSQYVSGCMKRPSYAPVSKFWLGFYGRVDETSEWNIG
jgi:hypothetical protein